MEHDTEPTEPRREKLSDLLHRSKLPAPPIARALLFGGIATLLATAAASMAAYSHDLPISYLSIGIAVLVAFAVVRARGHGGLLAISAAGLTLLAVVASYATTFVLETVGWCTEVKLTELHTDAEAWAQLSQPSDTEVYEFAAEQGFPFTTREAFDFYPGRMLDWMAETKPDLSSWRRWELSNSSFGDYLRYQCTSIDLAVVVLALIIAAGIVMLRTSKLETRATQQAIARRNARDGHD